MNRLKEEKSAYLLQHKDNPVNWWPFGEEPLKKAREENRPIFLSIGYSSCHWCHVMAHESFENSDTAKLLNENFICIKVDREEYPDLDAHYQKACQVITQMGGWPLSAFLLPDMRPFFVGTYFPPVALSHDGISFPELLNQLSNQFNNHRSEIETNAQEIAETVEKGLLSNEKVQFEGHFPSPASILEAIKDHRDEENGGYGEAPKFPQFAFYEWSLEQILEGMVPEEETNHLVSSIEKMMSGGVFDHIRGGIHRYSVDESWSVPHFEKMLYDQAGLLKLLSKLILICPSPIIIDGLIKTLDYVESEMWSDQGYFFSSQDADSEGVEGLYFTFTEEEFEDAIKDSDELLERCDDLKKWLNIQKEGNFERGLNIVSYNDQYNKEFLNEEGHLLIKKTFAALLQERKNRIPPATDSKGIASWNAMLISALTDVVQFSGIEKIKKRGRELLLHTYPSVIKTFLMTPIHAQENIIIRHSTTKESSLPYFEDYLFFAEMLLRVYEVTGIAQIKKDFLDLLSYIHREFIQDGDVLTRAVHAQEAANYPNSKQSAFDSSFRAPIATLVLISRRAAMLAKDPSILQPIVNLQENIIHESLKNPLMSGEALRALTYPQQAFKILQIPAKWIDSPQYMQFISFFMHRFTLNYHEDNTEWWQICNTTTCEVQGEGLENFLATLTPPKDNPKDNQKNNPKDNKEEQK